MGLFNILESVFFITLGISCVLLMMLIYHFKQRISKLEKNGDTMFEILNNMVQELTAIKHTINNPMGNQIPSNFNYPDENYEKINVSLNEEVENDFYEKLNDSGIDVLLDDRDCSPGVKFSDAELIGVPYQVIVSKNCIESNSYEVVSRNDLSKKILTEEELFALFS